MIASSGGAVNISTNGTTAITVDTSQNVGIGTTSPQTRLHTFSSATTTTISIQGSLSAGANTPTLDFTGNNAGYSFGSRIQAIRDTVSGGYALAFGTTANNAAESSAPTERMRINSSGSLLVGATATLASERLYLYGNATAGNPALVCDKAAAGATGCNQILFNNNNGFVGSITTSGSLTSYNVSSDYRLKENITPMQNALNVVQQLKPVTYNWKSDGSDGQGFIAHELQAVVPDCVTGEKDAVDAEGNPVYQGIDTSFLVATLTAAIQELNAKVDAQFATIAELQAKVGV